MLLERKHIHDLLAQPIVDAAAAIRNLENSPLLVVAELTLRLSDESVRLVFDSLVEALERAEAFDINHYAMVSRVRN